MNRKLLSAALAALAWLAAAPPAVAGERYACEPDVLEVTFAPEFRLRLAGGRPADLEGANLAGALEPALTPLGKHRWERLAAAVPEERLDELHARAEAAWGEPIGNLNNTCYLWLEADPLPDVWAAAAALERRPGVLRAMPVPRPLPLPTPDHEPKQEYLRNTPDWPPTGIGADFAWTRTGGDGAGVTVVDLEYSWNLNHLDVSQAATALWNGTPIHDPESNANHGTAVIGELVADDNGWGVTGICKGAQLGLFGSYFDHIPPYTNPIWRVPEAIAMVTNALSAGDVILIEQQWRYYPTSATWYVPIEFWGDTYPSPQTANPAYTAIQTAVGNGIHVVEPAGNGNVNLDNIVWYGDSGALVVGAGGAFPGGSAPADWADDLEHCSFSSYGQRVNLQGWGENVYTTGYGDLAGSTGPNDAFTGCFAGTSSAAPMVAAAVACCNGYWTGWLNQPAPGFDPWMMRSILINTGTPEVGTIPPAPIGPRPSLEGAFAMLDALAPAVIVTVELQMPSHEFHTGDACWLNAIVTNPGPPLGIMPGVCLLEVYGGFYFYPAWTPAIQVVPVDVVTGSQTIPVVPSFTWPAGAGTASGLHFYSALLTLDLTSILGLYGTWEFGFSS